MPDPEQIKRALEFKMAIADLVNLAFINGSIILFSG